jgi:phosphate:Na+ symporter
MDWKTVVFQVFGGLGLFLMGMKIMSEGMQKAAGERLRKILRILTSNRFIGVLVGFVITAIIQSSSATSVMVVGFVNATLMTVQQAIVVELGAAVGTTVTGWIVSLNVSEWAMPMIGLGVFIRFFSKDQTKQYFGEILFGFGILFLGMSAMKNGFAPLKHSEEFINLFKSIDGETFGSVLLGVLVGTITTAIVQSSSAVVGITIALASQGLVNFDGGLAIVMGSNIGTTITGILASIGGSTNAKRAALAQTLFKFFGVILILIVFYPFRDLVDWITPGNAVSNIMVHIAMGHTIFNILNLIVFLPAVPILAKIVTSIFPDKKSEEYGLPESFVNIDYNLIETPSMGILESEKELVVMAGLVKENLELLRDMSIDEKDASEKICESILRNEDRIDKYQYFITKFLVTLSSRALAFQDASKVGNYISLAHNLEKIADYTEHIASITEKVVRKKLKLSDVARDRINGLLDENINFFCKSIEILKQGDLVPGHYDEAVFRSVKIKKMIKDAKLEHFERLREEVCKGDAAIHFIDILNNFDAMRSDNFNIAEVVSGHK